MTNFKEIKIIKECEIDQLLKANQTEQTLLAKNAQRELLVYKLLHKNKKFKINYCPVIEDKTPDFQLNNKDVGEIFSINAILNKTPPAIYDVQNTYRNEVIIYQSSNKSLNKIRSKIIKGIYRKINKYRSILTNKMIIMISCSRHIDFNKIDGSKMDIKINKMIEEYNCVRSIYLLNVNNYLFHWGEDILSLKRQKFWLFK